MRIAKITKIIVALLVLSFVGQSVAAVRMSCSGQNSQNTDAAMMNHSQHMNMMTELATDSVADTDNNSALHCNDCACGPGGCSTALLPVYQPNFESSLSLLVNFPADFAESQQANSPYRPPIFR
tara:strand:- start:194 stop:565 length:372 start_codon:yes stop_codon:yes gene_type:complete